MTADVNADVNTGADAGTDVSAGTGTGGAPTQAKGTGSGSDSRYALPDVTRLDAELVTFSTWGVGTPERQRAAVEAIAATWQRLPWPTPDLLSYTVYTATDGETLAHFAQWTNEAARAAYVSAGQQVPHAKEIDAAVPGIERSGVTPYRRYRSAFTPEADGVGAPVPGCVIAVSIEFDGPDEERLRRWVDGWFHGDEAELDDAFNGLLAAHFHVSTDGTRVLNYAEWVSEQAHIDALAGVHDTHTESPEESAEDDQWRSQLTFPGLKATGFKRYHLSWSGTPQR
ncbi:antibiotic biosynthesis monooxygenase [Streptomyces zagrosensis]|uniref:Antibiotic biosynthesis monooxygenase n=1 Tax=Streptomyces zagrosensis TaxID=1042984 RepID=A0A7W9Q6P6_9ACTN|nr:antibiotic biosynthesis monooxygenase [Streptomyces zagrosensis]MBB5934643.1 hypothetical protein [Streptomyces zagrosensis]